MQIAVIIPACLQQPALLHQFRENLRVLHHDAIARVIVVCNRLTLMQVPALEALLAQDLQSPIQVLHDKERSVAGAWNRGIELAMDAGISAFLVTAVDVELPTKTIDLLLRFGETRPDVGVWSSTPNQELSDCRDECVDRCDFSCFMLRKSTIERHGWFDKEYKPAYFEDNDYAVRLVLGNQPAQQVIAARHRHEGSLTIKLDSEMAHHVQSWFEKNRARYIEKWKVLTDNYLQICQLCHTTPYDSKRPLSWWPEQERAGYSPSGGIHE